ncbi:MAG: LytTR family transcriptional regulator [Bacteroidaceae bacterium]|nr:LytTR family transcriptional regulator [Bacteroidaceae bacterium]
MKRTVIIAYWTVSVIIVALIIMMLVKNLALSRALFVGLVFLPGALAAQYMLPKISFKRRAEGIRNTIYLVLAIIILEYLLLVWTLCFQPTECYKMINGVSYYVPFDFPKDTGVFNPLFISVIISGLAIGGSLIDRWLTRNHPEMESPITFCSDRKRVSLLPSQIMYIESCDTEVYIHTTDGRKVRNKTGISQWESALGYPFVRIHRAFLVNGSHVESYNQDAIKIGEESLPVSRKYQKDLKDLL